MASRKSRNIYISKFFYGGQILHKYFRSLVKRYVFVNLLLIVYRRTA